MVKKALGKGLGALIQNTSQQQTRPTSDPTTDPTKPLDHSERVEKVSLDRIVPSPFQPRRQFPVQQLQELMDSIREHGIIQPLIVRKSTDGLELIAGERRWRASRELQLNEVPVIIREASDQDVLEMALIENLQRQDLDPIEEAVAYRRLVIEFQLKHEDIAQRVGKSRASVANTIRLLDLAPAVQDLLTKGDISVGHAKVILSIKEQETQRLVGEQVVLKQLSVRQTEKLLQELRRIPTTKRPTTPLDLDPRLQSICKNLSEQFATPVSISGKSNKGTIEINFRGESELARILELLGLESQIQA